MKRNLSKSQYIKGLQCHKALWLYRNEPDLRTPPDEAQQAIFDMGTDVGVFAQELFPGGTTIEFEGSSFDQKVKQTQQLIKDGVKTIYEATFIYDDIVVMVDILHKGKKGWDLYEVKGSTHFKEVNLSDISVQYYVLCGAGISVSRASLVHLNNKYERQGVIDVSKLFSIVDLTDEVKNNQDFVQDELSSIQQMLEGPCPDIDIGPRCSSPYECDFGNHCWQHIPENSVFDLRGKGIDKFEYYYKGMITFKDLDMDELNSKQKMQVEAELSDKSFINTSGIKEFLDELYYPQYFLDFETFMPAIPPFDGTRPYQTIPFQYSIHCLENDKAKLKHYEFLAEGGADPREQIAKDLTTLIQADACVIAYNSSFEKTRLKELADQFPKYKTKLMKIYDNMVDLMVPFRQRACYTKAMKGSYSIKYVLPALVSGLSYKGMAIADGGAAMNIYPTLHLIKDKKKLDQIRNDLLEYCKLDTLAMVKIVEKLEDMC